MLSLFTDEDVKTKRQKDFRFYTPNPKQASFHKAGKEAIEYTGLKNLDKNIGSLVSQ